MISISGSLSLLCDVIRPREKSAGAARYAFQDPSIHPRHTISTPIRIRSAFFLRRTQQLGCNTTLLHPNLDGTQHASPTFNNPRHFVTGFPNSLLSPVYAPGGQTETTHSFLSKETTLVW